ncbi:MAG: hypothetical protein IKE78_02505 [Erysipelotrichaceae bacterium]|nr:hypothetical protein [Erysipelotrichaceae bacterium]MBR2826364.1 hypothetical protein [Erysipelotrichaceae bacterium]MBR3352715.1 hypothetical protein [Erysipelotrichaceae bacterium]MBR6958151.1 hypothetical protein [Erysipelotrichaceae bacterium]
MTDRHKEIQNSYKQLGNMANFYDCIITRSTVIGKIMDSVIWGLDEKMAAKWINDAVSPIGVGFTGSLLEVPVFPLFYGTGVSGADKNQL